MSEGSARRDVALAHGILVVVSRGVLLAVVGAAALETALAALLLNVRAILLLLKFVERHRGTARRIAWAPGVTRRRERGGLGRAAVAGTVEASGTVVCGRGCRAGRLRGANLAILDLEALLGALLNDLDQPGLVNVDLLQVLSSAQVVYADPSLVIHTDVDIAMAST